MATHVGDIYVNAKLNDKQYQKGLSSIESSAGKVAGAVGRRFASTSDVVGKLGRRLATVFSVAAIGGFIKKTTEAGASLNAMGTIIDASLPNMTRQVDEFAKSAGHMFGLSETQAKGFVGRFATMASSMGYTEEQAYKMSTALTGLAGDMASYYHMSQDDAAYKLQAVFSGETESLRSLGIVMTQTALDNFALQQGFGKTTNQMSEMEKTTLRYQFVMNQLKLASGDFAKYANTWSGSIATIKLNWSNFMATVGQGIINILLPLLQLIARISNALTALGARFVGWTEKITGKGKTAGDTLKSAFGKSTQKSLSNAGNAIGGVNNNLGSTGSKAGKAKKQIQALKKELLGFDQIVKLTKEADAGTTSGGLGGVGGSGGGLGGLGADFGTDLPDTSQTAKDYVSDFAAKFKEAWKNADFTEIGAEVARKIDEALNKINWASIQKTCNKLAKSVATFLNGFFGEEQLWTDVGKTFAEALNTLIEAGYTFVTEFKWEKFGTAIANAVNGFFSNFDFKKLGQTIYKWADGLLTALNTALEKIDWKNVGKKIVEFISGINWVKLFSDAGNLIINLANALYDIIKGAVKQASEDIEKWMSENDILDVLPDVHEMLIKVKFYQDLPPWLQKVLEFTLNSNPIILDLKVVGYVADTVSDILGWFNGDKKDRQEMTFVARFVVSLAEGFEKIWKFVTGDEDAGFPIHVSITLPTWAEFKERWEKFKENFKEIVSNILIKIPTWAELKEKWESLKKKFEDFATSVKLKLPTWGDVKEKWESLKGKFEDFERDLKLKLPSWSDLKEKWSTLKGKFEDFERDLKLKLPSWSDLKEKWKSLKEKFTGKDVSIGISLPSWNSLKKSWNSLKSNFTGKNVSIGISLPSWNSLKNKWEGLKAKFKAGGGIYSGGSWHNIQRYAAGGAPNEGQLFWAREKGPELVGTLRGHTAVMNNDQIVASVSNGVAQAISGMRMQMQAPKLAITSNPQSSKQNPGADVARLEMLVTKLISVVEGMDLNVELDGEKIKNNTVSRINQHTISTGQLELVI